MADGSVVIASQIDDDGINRGLRRIQARLEGLNVSLLQTAKLGAAVVLATSLIPSVASATGAVVALSASFGAAGIGVGAFGAVAVSALGKVFEAADEVATLEEKIANADTAKERIAAQKELAALYADMSKAQRGALKDLQSFKSFWSDFVKQFENPIFEAFSSSLSFTKTLLNGLAPTITNVGDVINELLDEMNGFAEGGGLNSFFEWLETNAAESLYSFAHIAGNTMQGFFSLLQAFSPLGASMEEGLLGMTERFKEWAASLSSSTAFQDFIAYVQENGPVLLSIIGDVAEVLKNLVTDLAPLGSTVLEGIQSFTSLIADNWPLIRETVIGLTTAVGSFLAIMKGLQIISVINTLMLAYRSGTLLATLAQYGLNTAMLANPITWIVALIAGLIAIGVLLYRNWDTVKAKAKELWKDIKEKWEAIKQATIIAWGILKDVISEKISEAKKAVTNKASELATAAKNKFQDVVNGAKEKFELVKTTVSEKISEAKTAAVNKIQELATGARNKFQDIVNTAREKFLSAKSAITDPIKSAADFIGDQVEKIKGFFSGLKISLPKIKLPHFSLSGGFDLKPPGLSVPKISVNWYKDGGLFPANSPRLIGVGDNKSYKEAALPLSPSVLGMIGQKIADNMPGSNAPGGVVHNTYQLIMPNVRKESDARGISIKLADLENRSDRVRGGN
ncbi:hypothetical protein [Cytobacillus oceanisediminis]|uniref:hypothetical protein n=1 Tax=Cytobacillus oceanisediminis TaxID=665099 RepID=UPI0020793CCD|nr:hypothetical protein [Cytobacillus oceanisediminis]USK43531.1 hypothetical protein LIT27_23570 [Cytobacillus oceanisediminis]